MSKIDDGGPAHPVVGHKIDDTGRLMGQLAHGLSIRDWFAGQALQGILADLGGVRCSFQDIAAEAYAYADAMLAQRAKEQS